MAIKTISQFEAATPTSNDKILFEQNGEGKSAILEDLPISTKTQTALDAKVNISNVLTLEELQATTDLTGKVAGADNVKPLVNNNIFHIRKFFSESGSGTSVTFYNVPIDFRICGIVVGNGNGTQFFRYCSLFMNGDVNQDGINEGAISSTRNENGTANVTISSVNQWGYYHLIVFYTQLM